MEEIPAAILEKIREAQEKKLKKLDLSGNEFAFLSGDRLTSIPLAVFELKQLEELNFRRNYLTSIPEYIGRLQNLRRLDLNTNGLTTLPNAIGDLKKLEYLDCSNNRLVTLPESIGNLENLQYLNLAENRLEKPPPEVASKGIEAIREYFRQLAEVGLDRLFEAKLLIVGEPGAGKTSLAKKILDPGYRLREDESSTKGIEVIDWRFPLTEGRTFRVNIWDFGGQEIYHATHQFFLTKRSLYILVADTRKEDTDFYYWLQVVELLSDNSPILIVKNEKQDRHREIDERQLRAQFSNIKETLATNLFDNRGLDLVVTDIKHYITQLPHVGASLPKTWLWVRERLEKDPRNYINLEEYFAICQKHGFQEQQDKLQLSSYLHDLGVCLHFQDDPLLKKLLILKPTWGTEAVYKVLDNPEVISNLGRFDRKDLADIWNNLKYADRQDELLQLMINFKLCFQIPGTTGTYIAPQLLTESQPLYEWDNADNLLLRYTYDFMPKGILSRFIVEMHRWIADQVLVWRRGVVLESEQTRAEVIEHYNRREINIRVAGQHPRDLLMVVTHELEKIHDTYPRLKFRKLIPCNCTDCYNNPEPIFFEFGVLRKFMADRQPLIQCQKSYRMVDVVGLMDNVLDKEQFWEPKVPGDIWSISKKTRTKVFISYAHKDKPWLNRLQTHLKPLERWGLIDLWDDTRIKPGMKWRREIGKAIANAKGAILLLSADFLASDFITTHELPPLLAAAEAEGCLILPIIVSPCLIPKELKQFQFVNDPSRPLKKMVEADQEEIFVEVARAILKSFEGFEGE